MKIFSTLCLLVLCACSQQPPQVLSSRYLDPSDFQKIAQTKLNKINDEGAPDGSAGVIFYATIKNQPHILFVKYRKDESYGDLRDQLGDHENFMRAARRVAAAGTAGLYKPTEDELSKAKMYYETQRSGHQVLIFVLNTKEINYTKNLVTAQEFCKESECYLCDEFKWIPAKKLLVQSKPIFRSDNGSETPLSLSTWSSIQQPAFRQILMDLIKE